MYQKWPHTSLFDAKGGLFSFIYRSLFFNRLLAYASKAIEKEREKDDKREETSLSNKSASMWPLFMHVTSQQANWE
jgi:hypothetical protein